jgi:hypothetical protein
MFNWFRKKNNFLLNSVLTHLKKDVVVVNPQTELYLVNGYFTKEKIVEFHERVLRHCFEQCKTEYISSIIVSDYRMDFPTNLHMKVFCKHAKKYFSQFNFFEMVHKENCLFFHTKKVLKYYNDFKAVVSTPEDNTITQGIYR